MFFDRPKNGERALLVHCDFTQINSLLPSSKKVDIASSIDNKSIISEFSELASSAGADVVQVYKISRKIPNSKFFIGSGKILEIKECVRNEKIEIVMFNHNLSPSQERNIEKELNCKVIDRTGLILDIFAQRARSHIGKLQVELAQLDHISTRLVRGWTHLERQKGGIGLRGPGESQLETDRRLLRERIKWIRQRLSKVNKQREQGRKSRKRAELPTIAIIGYTNAGKSTLFNSLVKESVFAADQLFATLDPTLRALEIPQFGKVILADTVGFVRDLPHKLVDAFKATLDEATEADLLLHVIDASSDDVSSNIEAVNNVLEEIDASDIPMLQVMNKIDCLDNIKTDELPNHEKVWISASTGEGIPHLLSTIAKNIGGAYWKGKLTLAASQCKLRSKLYSSGAVLAEEISTFGDFILEIDFPKNELIRLLDTEGQILPSRN